MNLQNNEWLAAVTCDGIDGMGAVLGYVVGPTEQSVHIPRGELFDILGLFINEDPTDDVSVEISDVSRFYLAYEDRMPLGNNGIRI
jgi:hypothetical protein